MLSSYLRHHGVLGMRWGRKHGSSESSNPDHQTAHALKGKRVQDMSNDELRTLTNRIQLEKQFKEARRQDMSPGKKLVADVMMQAGKQVATTYVAKGMNHGVETIIKALSSKK